MANLHHSFEPSASMDSLRRRSRLLNGIRSFFESRDFLHVETPLISRDSVVDRYIDPVEFSAAKVTGVAGDQQRLFLQTSPEFAMKRLLASGAEAIYQICKAFRQGESGARHNPEFTMLEWYRVGDDFRAGMQLLAEFAEHFLKVPATQTSYRDAFLEHAAVDPFTASVEQLKAACHANGIDTLSFAGETEIDAWLNLLMSEVVEPRLGSGSEAAVILYHFPASQSALANVIRGEDGIEVAERFELYHRGVELANGYHELTDATELMTRNQKVNAQRSADGNARLPEQSQLLAAMQAGLPSCSGVALGVDRLMMLLLEADSIKEVIAFPFETA